MTNFLFILNEGPYGSERAYNALRLAGALAGNGNQQVRIFLLGDAVGCARAGQKVPEGYYNIQLMLGKIARHGEIGVCGTCLDARGFTEVELADGGHRSTLAALAAWIVESDKVLVF